MSTESEVRKDKEKLIKTITNLINLADDQIGTPEGDLARRRASEMLAKYNIDMVEINGNGNGTNYMGSEVIGAYYPNEPNSWEARLGWDLPKIFNCRSIRTAEVWRGMTEKFYFTFVGHVADLALATYFYDVCRRHIDRASMKRFPKPDNGRRDMKKSSRSAFAWGMQQRIVERLRDMYEEAVLSSDCVALVLKSKADKAEAYLHELFPNQKSVRLRSQALLDDRAAREGRAKADEVFLGRPVNGAKNSGYLE